jgi:hypothetical protein
MAYDKIVDSQILDNTFTQIANAIREKTGLTDTLDPSSMAHAITNIDNSDEYKDLYEAEKKRADGLAEKLAVAGQSKQDLIDLIERDVTEIVIPEGVTMIGKYVFNNYSNLTEITIPNSVTIIGNNAFRNCAGLTDITIPNSVTSISDEAFLNCTQLTKVHYNAINCTYAGNHVKPIFGGCTSLTEINIGENVQTLPISALYKCTKLSNIVVAENNSVYDSRNNCNAIIETETNTLVTGCKTTVIPDSVTSIGNWAFAYSGLTELIIPDTITTIGSYVGTESLSLKKVVIGKNVKSLDICFCHVCTALNEISILTTQLTQLPDYFCYGSAITEFVVPQGVTYIGNMFMGAKLKSLYLPATLTGIHGNAFNILTNLEFVTLEQGFNSSINLSFSTKYSVETIVSWLEALADRTGQTAKTLTIGSTNLAKLTDDQIAIATNKNWTLA